MISLAIEQVKAGYIEKNQLLTKMNDKIDLAEFECCKRFFNNSGAVIRNTNFIDDSYTEKPACSVLVFLQNK